MSMTSTRPTASFTVAPTQNTAQVLDFRCLYTFDLRRKAKRWQDGLAKYHCFNKRIMVYDESRNWIGDHHWRESEPIQDGDELQLDKGIIIQIGEATGKTDQDISGLFEKRKAKDSTGEGSSPVRSPMTQAAQSSAVIHPSPAVLSQLRPKTLNALLGTPKGRIGRAALPDKSPFEERNTGRENEFQERPAKRQRIMHAHEEVSTPAVAKAKKPPNPQQPVRTVQNPGSPKQPVVVPPRQGSEKIALCAEQKKASRDSKSKETRREKVKTPKRSAENGRPSESPGAVSQSPSRPSKEPEIQRRAPSEVIDVDMHSNSTVRCESPPPGARLKIATSKPRKKLMYKDLLPPVRSVTEQINITRAVEEDDTPLRKVKPVKSKSKKSRNEPLSQFHREQRDRMRQRLEKHSQRNESSIHPSIERLDNDVEPLFVSDDEFPTPLPDYSDEEDHRIRAEESVPSPDTDRHTPPPQASKDVPINSPPATNSADLERAKMVEVLLQRPRINPSLPLPAEVVRPPPRTSPPAELIDSRPPLAPLAELTDLIPPAPPPPVESAKPFALPPLPPEKATRACLPVTAQPTIPSAKPPIPPAPPQESNSKPVQRSLSSVITSTTNATTKRALRKTVSDTATVLSAPKSNLITKSAATSVEAAPDPWSREAWDLFGFGRDSFVKTGLEGIREKALK